MMEYTVFEIAKERIIPGRFPGLELVFEHFSRSFRKELYTLLGRDHAIDLQKIEAKKFADMLSVLPTPSQLHLFRLPPKTGQSLVHLSPNLAYLLVDVMMGGPGKLPGDLPSREFSSLENRLLTKVVAAILEQLAESWQHAERIDAVYCRPEFNPQLLNFLPETETVVQATLSITFGKQKGGLTIVFPRSIIRESLTSLPADAVEDNPQLAVHLLKTTAEVSVELGKSEISVEEASQIQTGDFIPLKQLQPRHAVMSVGGRPKFLGLVSEKNGSKIFQVSKKLDSE